MRRQRTLRNAVEFSGKGLHSGETVDVRVLPAPQGTGVEFVRTDMPDAPHVPADITYRQAMDRRTRLQRGPAQIDTVEHLLAACSGLQIDNLTVEISGQEVPGMDGSAQTMVDLFKKAGVVEQRATARSFQLDQPIFVRDRDATLVALPVDEPQLTLQYIASFEDPSIENGSMQLTVSPESFEAEIASARTFCLASEVEPLRAAGLGKGADRENTVVLGDPDTVMRMPSEPVRHKMLDLLGDLHLLGADLHAHIIATRSGHETNANLVRQLRDLMQAQERGGLVKRESGLDVRAVMRMLPHRYPFLLLDRVLELDGYKRAVAIKNVSINEPFFQGHFPGAPIMPGVLIVEALAQTAAVLVVDTLGKEGEDLLVYFMTVDKCRFRQRVVPGDRLELHVRVIRGRGRIWKFWGEGRVNGQVAAECEFSAMIVSPEDRVRQPASRG